QKMREARKRKDLTQQELSDLSHVSVKQIAKIEKGQMNPSFLILKALAKVLHPLGLGQRWSSLFTPDGLHQKNGYSSDSGMFCTFSSLAS
ncbi:MAG: helix-turn-helix transcriptional regulator, partial [Lachnospiraceae bacterium]|nr:helix-turn-helix transcriptional regulator [Lachnospiraceae bacterium]